VGGVVWRFRNKFTQAGSRTSPPSHKSNGLFVHSLNFFFEEIALAICNGDGIAMVRRHSNDGCVAVNRGGALSTPGVFQRHTVRDFPVFSPTVAADGSRSWRLPRRDGLRLRTTPASRRAKPLHCLTHPHGQSAFTAPFLQPLRILLTPTPPPPPQAPRAIQLILPCPPRYPCEVCE